MWTQKSFSSKKTPIFCPNGSSIHKVYFSKTSVNKCLTYDFRKNALLEWKLNFNQFEQFFKIFSPKNSPIYRKFAEIRVSIKKAYLFQKWLTIFGKTIFEEKCNLDHTIFRKTTEFLSERMIAISLWNVTEKYLFFVVIIFKRTLICLIDFRIDLRNDLVISLSVL